MDVEFPVLVGTSEITGSETFVHVRVGDEPWVALMHGVHRVNAGDQLSMYADPANYFLFDTLGRAGARTCRCTRGRLIMARITLERLAHSYLPNPAR